MLMERTIDTILPLAYVGPGAGFAFLSSFLAFFLAFALAGSIFITTPLRILWRAVRRRRKCPKGRYRKVVIVGLDGMSPVLARRMIDEGKLPNFAELEKQGTFSPLRSTLPSVSPVAWSTFQTGTTPDRHNIFDFLTRDKKTYLPVLSSTKIDPPKRSLRIGPYRIPLGKPRITSLRKSKPFWHVLGEQGVPSIVLRVPITFPPEKFSGMMLSAMCVPDLRGSQGSFTYFTTADESDDHTGGLRIRVKREGSVIKASMPGPPNPLRPDSDKPLEAPFRIEFKKNGQIQLRHGRNKHALTEGEYTPWIRLQFKAGFGMNVTGVCRFRLLQAGPEFKLYATPINIDPERPALPISHPFLFAPYLAKTQGTFATLGLAEDTWALNEGILDETAFLEQAYAIHEERRRMLFDAIDKVGRGMVACVFDATDRIQHMFFQYTPEARAAGSDPNPSPHELAVEECYIKMDEMIGDVRKRLRDDDLLMVISDHGFASFHTGVNLNAWLLDKGLLHLKEGHSASGDLFQHVDWSRTKAYALGLGGIFINQKDREGQGIVAKGKERQEVIRRISEGLAELRDPSHEDAPVVRRVYDSHKRYRGPYAGNGPDLIVGFNDGYRVSWDCVTGKFGQEVLQRNEKNWAADHCIDPDVVPGVLFSNAKLSTESSGLIDIAPTVLESFNIDVPRYMQGVSLLPTQGELQETTERRDEEDMTAEPSDEEAVLT